MCIISSDIKLEIYSKLNEAKNKYANIQYEEAKHHMMNNNIQQCIDNATRAIEYNPQVSDYYIMRSAAYRMKKDYKKSKNDAKTAIKLSSTTPDGYIKLIENYIENNELTKATSTIQQIYHKFTDNRITQLINKINNPK